VVAPPAAIATPTGNVLTAELLTVAVAFVLAPPLLATAIGSALWPISTPAGNAFIDELLTIGFEVASIPVPLAI
jgi:hypothetical protein